MKVVTNNSSHVGTGVHKVSGRVSSQLKLVKSLFIPVSLKYMIGEDVEHFRNVEDFLSLGGADYDVVTMLTH